MRVNTRAFSLPAAVRIHEVSPSTQAPTHPRTMHPSTQALKPHKHSGTQFGGAIPYSLGEKDVVVIAKDSESLQHPLCY